MHDWEIFACSFIREKEKIGILQSGSEK